jgi:hypothetical protein
LLLAFQLALDALLLIAGWLVVLLPLLCLRQGLLGVSQVFYGFPCGLPIYFGHAIVNGAHMVDRVLTGGRRRSRRRRRTWRKRKALIVRKIGHVKRLEKCEWSWLTQLKSCIIEAKK